jgi:hypothetical protein
MAGIFICYRRDDSEGQALTLFQNLSEEFGRQQVFFDVAALKKGRDFRREIVDRVKQCDVALVVIGPKWVDQADAEGRQRLADPDDYVRIEVAAALGRDIPVIPVLVRGARMPSAAQLPEDLRELVYRDGVELTHARWETDLSVLVASLRTIVGSSALTKPRAWKLYTAGGIVTVGLGIGLFARFSSAPGPAPALPAPSVPVLAAVPMPASAAATAPAPATAVSPPAASAPATPPALAKTAVARPPAKTPTPAATERAKEKPAEKVVVATPAPSATDALAEKRAAERSTRIKGAVGTWVSSWACSNVRGKDTEVSEVWELSVADSGSGMASVFLQAYAETAYVGETGSVLGSGVRKRMVMPRCKLDGGPSSHDDTSWKLSSSAEGCRVLDGGASRVLDLSFSHRAPSDEATLELVRGGPCSDRSLLGSSASMHRK